jgi:cyclopropane fatty-acyl-phospholipid synthase-like methyltransferase
VNPLQRCQQWDGTVPSELLDRHYDVGAGLYKFWASPASAFDAVCKGWRSAAHPAQLHYAWDLAAAESLDAAIRRTTTEAVERLGLHRQHAVKVLDAGCGIGGATCQIAAERPAWQLHGITRVRRQAQIARERAARAGVQNAAFEHGSYLAAPWSDGEFHGIYAIESLCYTPAGQRPQLMAEMYRLLCPGGRLVVADGYSSKAPQPGQRDWIQDVLDGWTMPMPVSVQQAVTDATEVGFVVEGVEDATHQVLASAVRIGRIGRLLLRPLAQLAAVPGLRPLLAPLGFASVEGARQFAKACEAQERVLVEGLGTYQIFVLRKPD